MIIIRTLVVLLAAGMLACSSTPTGDEPREGEGEEGEGEEGEDREAIQNAYQRLILTYFIQQLDCLPFIAQADNRDVMIEMVTEQSGQFSYEALWRYPGQDVTVAGIEECAAAFAGLSCDELQSGLQDVCRTLLTGSFANGADCVVSGQCESGSCDAAAQGCGSCAVPNRIIECSSDCACRASQHCGFGICQRSLPTAGDTCDQNLGDTCLTPPSGLFCDRTVCQAMTIAELGEPCGASAACRGSFTGLTFCASPPGLCTAYVGVGQACTANECRAGLWCNSRACAELPAAGEDCSNAPCAPGLLCESNICTPIPAAGEPCFVSCVDGYTCEQGTCLSYSDAFAQACAP